MVVNRIQPRRGTSIASNRAAAGWIRLGRCVVDVVATVAATLKGMNEIMPVADFVNGNLARAELIAVTAGGRPSAHHTTIIGQIAVTGVCAVASIGVVGANVGDVVQIERAKASTAQGTLHAVLVAIMRPVAVDSPVNVSKCILKACALKVLVEYCNLLVDSGSLKRNNSVKMRNSNSCRHGEHTERYQLDGEVESETTWTYTST